MNDVRRRSLRGRKRLTAIAALGLAALVGWQYANQGFEPVDTGAASPPVDVIEQPVSADIDEANSVPAPATEALTLELADGEANAADAGVASATETSVTALPRDTALAEVFDELAARADAGDADAACRLAWDLDLCQRSELVAQSADAAIESIASTTPGSADERFWIETLDMEHRWTDRAAKVCAGLSAKQRQQTTERMAQAAQLGHTLSMARFAIAPPFPQRLQLRDTAMMQYYLDNAFELLARGAAFGEPSALFGLWRACSRGEIVSGVGRTTVGRDPVCALAAALALHDISTGNTLNELHVAIPELEAELDGGRLAYARERAERYQRAILGRAPRDLSEGIFGNAIGETCVPAE